MDGLAALGRMPRDALPGPFPFLLDVRSIVREFRCVGASVRATRKEPSPIRPDVFRTPNNVFSMRPRCFRTAPMTRQDGGMFSRRGRIPSTRGKGSGALRGMPSLLLPRTFRVGPTVSRVPACLPHAEGFLPDGAEHRSDCARVSAVGASLPATRGGLRIRPVRQQSF